MRSIHKSGNAFDICTIRGCKPISSFPELDKVNYVSLTEWCQKNYISKKVGRTLIKKKYLLAQRLYGRWWVCANLHCLEQLLEYLSLEQLFFDANNQLV